MIFSPNRILRLEIRFWALVGRLMAWRKVGASVKDSPESGCNSVVECQLPKLDVAGSTPVARSTTSLNRISHLRRSARRAASAGSARGGHFQAKFRLFRREFGGKLVS